LTITATDLANALNNHEQVDMAILDFSKAFDKVPHQRLLRKLEYYGISGTTAGWIKNFLSDRSQRVLVDGEASDESPVLSGVPQGTVIGPLLFLIFINDITDGIGSTVRLFADDCLVYRKIKNQRDTQHLQEDLDRLDNWSKEWQMAFNVSKCYIMRVTLARKHIVRHTYTMNNQTLEVTPSNPYLGVEIDSKLCWDQHINITVSKASRMLGFLRRNLRQCPMKIKEKAYQTLVRPKLEYCCPIWSPHQAKYIQKVESIQRAAARFVLNKPHWKYPTASVTEMVKTLEWQTLETRRKALSLTSLYKIQNQLVDIPAEYCPAPKTQQATRRSNEQQMEHYQCHVNAFRYSLIPRAVPMWNQLPQEVVGAHDLDTFKARLWSHL
jgi:hypothetical protein